MKTGQLPASVATGWLRSGAAVTGQPGKASRSASTRLAAVVRTRVTRVGTVTAPNAGNVLQRASGHVEAGHEHIVVHIAAVQHATLRGEAVARGQRAVSVAWAVGSVLSKSSSAPVHKLNHAIEHFDLLHAAPAPPGRDESTKLP